MSEVRQCERGPTGDFFLLFFFHIVFGLYIDGLFLLLFFFHIVFLLYIEFFSSTGGEARQCETVSDRLSYFILF